MNDDSSADRLERRERKHLADMVERLLDELAAEKKRADGERFLEAVTELEAATARAEKAERAAADAYRVIAACEERAQQAERTRDAAQAVASREQDRARTLAERARLSDREAAEQHDRASTLSACLEAQTALLVLTVGWLDSAIPLLAEDDEADEEEMDEVRDVVAKVRRHLEAIGWVAPEGHPWATPAAPDGRAVLPPDLANLPDEPPVDVDAEAALRWMDGTDPLPPEGT